MTEAALDPLTQQAINAALNNEWPTAVEINETLLSKYPNDVETLNRLGRAYFEVGQFSKAKTVYRKALEIDPYNSIALKNQKRIAEIKVNDFNNRKKSVNALNSLGFMKDNGAPLNPDIFLEEPGKTKVLALTELAPPEVLANLHNGDNVSLTSYRNEVVVTSVHGQRLGKISDEWGEKIAKAIRLGSKFGAIIKANQLKRNKSETARLTILVRELERAKELEGNPFFPINNHAGFTPFVSEETISLLNIEQTEESPENQSFEGTDEENVNYEHSPQPYNSLESLAKKEEDALEELEKEDS
jgi:tetratricopeptide (TPR) repeat protein